MQLMTIMVFVIFIVFMVYNKLHIKDQQVVKEEAKELQQKQEIQKRGKT